MKICTWSMVKYRASIGASRPAPPPPRTRVSAPYSPEGIIYTKSRYKKKQFPEGFFATVLTQVSFSSRLLRVRTYTRREEAKEPSSLSLLGGFISPTDHHFLARRSVVAKQFLGVSWVFGFLVSPSSGIISITNHKIINLPTTAASTTEGVY